MDLNHNVTDCLKLFPFKSLTIVITTRFQYHFPDPSQTSQRKPCLNNGIWKHVKCLC